MKCPKCGHEFETEENHTEFENRGESQKKGMIKKFSEGKHMSRAPFGYDWDLRDKILIPAKNSREVEEIFEEFLKEDSNLSILAQKHKLSVKRIKENFKKFCLCRKS
jgi:DNA invertase Pin-like site-specific DNA recombinase